MADNSQSFATAPRPHQGQAPWILQWNCRTFARQKPELLIRYRTWTQPTVFLLQETRDSNLAVPGYDIYLRPTIPRRQRMSRKPVGITSMQPVAYDGNAAVLVDNRFPHVELDLQCWGTSHQEVVGVTLQLHQREVVLVSVYVRPSVRKTAQVDWSWLENLRKTRPGALFVFGDDFNTHHTHWGVRADTFHGTNLVRAMEDNNFTLINDIDCPTRISQHDRQDDTTTDLTWTNKPKSIAWELGADTWGSDHFPNFLRLRGPAGQTAKYATSVVYWDRFHETLEATLLNTIYDGNPGRSFCWKPAWKNF
ncbi:hypothetical protein HPB48_000140 [Haemaphysalis longicornis]|uniref:Endonuclease/exonuclease/phosphatase domain-containing protein n=1 Tax=Haemaphysalis longicornis TaxID=44386 RepID=A0A9J6H602_HAELO|nr:hypothetical protein HPB48_000140 [Haemaphysalis longicornis]